MASLPHFVMLLMRDLASRFFAMLRIMLLSSAHCYRKMSDERVCFKVLFSLIDLISKALANIVMI